MNEIVRKFYWLVINLCPKCKTTCGPFIKNKEKIEKFIQTGNTDFFYRNEFDKACFQHDMAYGKSKDLAKKKKKNSIRQSFKR